MLKSVFCVDFTGFDCLAFEPNYAITKRYGVWTYIVCNRNVEQRLVSSDIQLVQIFAVFVV